MADRHPLDETELGSLIAAEIDDAQGYAASELNADRIKAIEYYRGEMNDLPWEEGRSSVVDHTMQDVIGWMMPGLMRVFFSGEQIAAYEPKGPEDEEGAKQATDYVTHVVLKENNAYQIFWDWFHDALLHRNGILKHYWDATPDFQTRRLFGLTDDQLAQATAEDSVEVLEHTARPMPVPVEMAGPDGNPIWVPNEVILHDVKIKVRVSDGSLKLKTVPPEQFLISKEATEIDRPRFLGERFTKTRSELMEMGLDPEVVDDLPAHGGLDLEGVGIARQTGDGIVSGVGWDRSTEEIECFEVYPLVDVDGDGVAERLKVLCAGTSGNKILDWEVWDDDHPYSDLTPERVPHRWSGRSIYDDTADIQRSKTAIMRQCFDNLYMSNIPDRVVRTDLIDNPDAVLDRRIGNVIRANGEGNAIVDLVVPFTAGASFQVLEYLDAMVEKRTGVSRSSMGLDPETLTAQTATASSIQQSAAYSKIELIARNFAEMGMKRAFRQILKLVVKHQDRAKTIRLRNEWVEMDPRAWSADMDVTVNVGLGSGSRDRDLQYLAVIAGKQEQVVAMVGGPQSTYGALMSKALQKTYAKMVEASGLRAPDSFFPELTDEHLQEMAQAGGENPEAEKAKAEMEMAQQKAAAQLQLEGQKSQAQMQAKQAEAEMDGQIRLQQIDAELSLKRYQIDAEMALKREQLIAELELKRELGFANAAVKANGTSGVHVGGDPG